MLLCNIVIKNSDQGDLLDAPAIGISYEVAINIAPESALGPFCIQ